MCEIGVASIKGVDYKGHVSRLERSVTSRWAWEAGPTGPAAVHLACALRPDVRFHLRGGASARTRGLRPAPPVDPQSEAKVTMRARRRRRFPAEVMGEEHGKLGLEHRPDCDEPSAPAGVFSLRPAGACLQGKCRRLRATLSIRLGSASFVASHSIWEFGRPR